MVLPTSIPLITLPYLGVATLLLWTGVFFIGFYGYLPRSNPRRIEYLFFGLSSLSLAVYTCIGFLLFSIQDTQTLVYLGNLQFISSIPLIIFFLQFSAYHLGYRNIYYRWVLPLTILAFLPLFYFDQLMLKSNITYQVFEIFGLQTRAPIFPFGPMAYPFLAWSFGNAFFVGYCWIRHIFRKTEEIALLFSFVLFVAAATHDTLVSLKVSQGPDLFIFGFCGFLIAMALQLFSDYIELNRELVRKTEELEKLNDELHFLASTLSHDFMAPLISIQGFVDLLSEEKGRESNFQEHYLKRIEANVEHMKSLSSDLVDFMRIGQVEDEIEEIQWDPLVNEILSILDLESQSPQATVELPEHWPPFQGNPKRIKQIFLNLFHNSLKYTDRDKIQFKVEAKTSKNGVLCALCDNGPGIPKEISERVFETFFRSNSQTEGTGMGLSIVRKIVNNSGGRVWVDTAFSQGARICFYLPNSSTYRAQDRVLS